MISTRRVFLQSTLSMASGALVLIACNDDSGYPPSDSGTPADSGGPSDQGTPVDNGAPTQPTATISANHGHTLVVPVADVEAGVEQTYDITGAAGHAHSVTLSAADFATIASSGTAVVQSTSGSGHSHSVTVMS